MGGWVVRELFANNMSLPFGAVARYLNTFFGPIEVGFGDIAGYHLSTLPKE
jgi:hypothetical protein